MAANVLPIINLPMALGRLPIAVNDLPLVLIGNDIWAITNLVLKIIIPQTMH